MAIIDPMDILMAQDMSQYEIDFDSMMIPSMYNYLSPYDIEELHKIATSAKLSAKVQEKYRLIEAIMKPRGFKRFAAGTNRVVYSYLEDDRFLVKIAMDRVGMQDNPAEFKNQFLLKPYVAKVFQVSPCGTVAFVERVLPIKNKEEFKEVAGDIFEILVNKILGEYVMEDIGAKYFMNWGIRKFAHPVLLDYPYLYKLDGSKLFCNKIDEHGQYCNGEIDYDIGFNHLVCSKCGKEYLASDVGEKEKILVKKGESNMKITVVRGNKVISQNFTSANVIEKKASVEDDFNDFNFSPMKVEIVKAHRNEQPEINNTVNTKPIKPMKVEIVRKNVEEPVTAETPVIETRMNDPKEFLRNNLRKIIDNDEYLLDYNKLISAIRNEYHIDEIKELYDEKAPEEENVLEENEDTSTSEEYNEVDATEELRETEENASEEDAESDEDSDDEPEYEDELDCDEEEEKEGEEEMTKEYANSQEDIDKRDNLSDYDDDYDEYDRITPKRIKIGGSKKHNNKQHFRNEEDD